MFIKSDDNTGNAQNNIQNPKPLDHSSKDVGLSTFKIWILIIFSFLAISIIGIAITLLILWIKGNLKQDNKIKHREYSRVLAEELRKENIDIPRVRRALRDLIDTNDENEKFDTDLSEEEKKEYKEESANVIIKTMTWTNERSNNNNLDIIWSKNNVYLNQGRTLFYKYVVKHIEEFENISSNEDLSEDEKDREIEVLMKEKLNDFLDNISKVFISINSKQDEIIKSFKDKLENGDPLVITGKLWISEYLRLFEVCNAAILTDLYYAVVNTKEEPIFFKNANFNKSSNGLRRRIEI